MKQNRQGCPNCRGFSLVKFDGVYQCMECRDFFHAHPPEEDPPPRTEPNHGTAVIHNFVTICGISPEVEVVVEQYSNGGPGLQLWDHEGPLMTATVWVPGIPEGRVAIKDYAENQGCLEELIRHGVVDPPEAFLDGLPICRLGRLFREQPVT